MTAQLMAVTGMTVGTDPNIVEATIVIPPGTAPVLGESKNAYLSGLTGQVTNITVPSAGATEPDPGPYDAVFTATSLKNTSTTIPLLREGDVSEVINATPQQPGDPPVDFPVSFVLVISAAGQSSVLIE